MPDIYINKIKHPIGERDSMLGATIRMLAGKSNEYNLFQDLPDKEDDVLIDSGERVEIKGGERFYTAPKTI